jgi:hypothetical protein
MPTGTSDGQYYESDLHQLFNIPTEGATEPAGASKLKTGTGVANEKERTSEAPSSSHEAPITKIDGSERSKTLDDFIKEMDDKELEETLTKLGYYKHPDKFLTHLSPEPSKNVDNRIGRNVPPEPQHVIDARTEAYWKRANELSEDPMAKDAGIDKIGEGTQFPDVPLPKRKPKK